jgi:hypothetical protein
MSTENDVARSLRSWLRENRHEDADRVLDAVFDQVPATPQRRAGWLARRFPVMNSNIVRFGVAAAVLVVAVIFGINYLAGPNVGEDPSPTPNSSPTVLDNQDGPLAAGTYIIDSMPARITFTVPTGWEYSGPGSPDVKGVDKPETDSSAEVLVAFWLVDRVYGDACDFTTNRAVGPSVDELVDALTTMSSVGFTTPTGASIDGFAGQHLTLLRTVDCDGDYRLWGTPGSAARVDHGQGDPVPTSSGFSTLTEHDC